MYCWSRISWVLALSVVVSCFVGTAFAADAITTVEVVGNRTVGAESIRSHLRAGRAGNISAGQIDEALKSLFATGFFADEGRCGAERPASVLDRTVALITYRRAAPLTCEGVSPSWAASALPAR